MDVFFWILAILALLGGLLAAMEENFQWLIPGLASFVILGGFASVIGLLKRMSANLEEVKDELATLHREKPAEKPDAPEQTPPEEQSRAEEQRRQEEVQKLLEEKLRMKAEEEKRLEALRRKEAQQRIEEKLRMDAEEMRLETLPGMREPWKPAAPAEEETVQTQRVILRKEAADENPFEAQTGAEEAALRAAAQEEKAAHFHELGEEVVFGRYQHEEYGAGTGIVWIVLDTYHHQSLLLSKLALDTQKYHQARLDTNWQKCDLRKWLNQEFFEKAFSADEQKAVCATMLSEDRTKDKVFLLSEAEARKYFVSENDRLCQVTPHAKGSFAYSSGSGNGWWWLRTSGKKNDTVLCVDTEGRIKSVDVDNSSCCIRPAIWVNTDLIRELL